MSKFLEYNDRPSFLLCDYEWIALDASFEFQRKGIIIPNNLQMLSISTAATDLEKHANLSIATVYYLAVDMAKSAINLVEKMLSSGDYSPSTVIIEPEFQDGESIII